MLSRSSSTAAGTLGFGSQGTWGREKTLAPQVRAGPSVTGRTLIARIRNASGRPGHGEGGESAPHTLVATVTGTVGHAERAAETLLQGWWTTPDKDQPFPVDLTVVDELVQGPHDHAEVFGRLGRTRCAVSARLKLS